MGIATVARLAPEVGHHGDSGRRLGDNSAPILPRLASMNDPDPLPEPPPQTPPAATAVADLAPAACAARLAELFPALFAPGTAKPLKLRIQADIQQRAPGEFTRKSLSVFLHRHTTSNAYLRALVAAPQRIDLDGQAAGEVSDEHREAAKAELERRRAIHEARRAAEQAAQREAQREAQRQARDAEHQAQHARRAEDAAWRESTALARAFATTTLTRANFCALKGLTEAQLDAALAAAKPEPRAPRAVERSAPARSPAPRPPGRGATPPRGEAPRRKP
jgi:ProP effector